MVEVKKLHFAHVFGRGDDNLLREYGCKDAEKPGALVTEDPRAFRMFSGDRCNICFTWYMTEKTHWRPLHER